MPRPTFDREAIEAEIDRVRSLGLDALRTLWRTTFRSPPPAFGKDILARFLCWHIQEQAFGGLDSETEKHLGGLARGDRSRADRPRRLKPGTVLLREYQGERHTVIVVANGYVWREATYASLSRHGLERSPLSWPPERQRICDCDSRGQCVIGTAQRATCVESRNQATSGRRRATSGRQIRCCSISPSGRGAQTINPAVPIPQRCAIYTRKSASARSPLGDGECRP